MDGDAVKTIIDLIRQGGPVAMAVIFFIWGMVERNERRASQDERTKLLERIFTQAAESTAAMRQLTDIIVQGRGRRGG